MEGLQLLKQENPAEKVKQLFADQGPLCNSEGFYNHIGECWNDALQMIFLYSDGIKEIVQKKLAESEIDPQEVDRLMHPYVNQEVERVFKVKANNNNNNNISISSNVSLLSNSNNNNNNNNNTNNKNTSNMQEARRRINIITGIIKNIKQNETGIAVQLGYLYVDLAYDYLRTLQKRFHRHYLAESMRISEQDKVCSTEDARGSLALEKLKQISLLFRSGGKEGTLAGYFGKAVKVKNFTFKRNPKNINTLYEVGGDPVSRNNVMNIFTRFFSLPIVFKEYRNTHNFFGHRFIERETEKKYTINDNIVAIYCGIRLEKTGHAIAFYKCGGRSYLFDDNFGTIEFPWVDFFRLGLQTIGNKEKEIKKKWKKAYSLRYPDNKDDLIDLHYYFNGILTIRNEKDQLLFKTENYPYIVKYLYEHTENKTKFPEEYTTYLWTGKEIKLSNLDSTYPFESTTSIALENGETVTVTFRLEKGKNVYITQFTTFDFEGTLPTYAKSSGIQLGSRILEYNVTVEEILFQEQIEKVKQGKAKIDDIFYKNEYTLLKLGIERGDLQMVKTALEMGADIHKRIKDESPIFFAMTHDGIIDLEIAEYLLTHGADKDLNENTNLAKGLTPLQGSILFNEEEDVVKNVTFLLEKGADPKKPSSLENVLPIEFAMFWNLFPVRDLLIEYGGGIHTCFTKKILKRRTGSDSLVMYWIRKKNVVKAANLSYCYRDMEMEIWDDLNYENMIGETAVKLALALWESEWTKKLLDALLKNGADANYIDRFGLTPLYVAIKLGKFEFLKILMDFGANPNLYYPPLGTPLDYAKRLKRQEIVEYIEDKIKYTRNKNKKYEKQSTIKIKTRKVNKSKPLYKNNFVKQATRRALNKAQALAASNSLKKSNKTDDTKAKANV